MTRHWTTQDIPDQTGRTVVITGANSGLGFQATRALAAKGATVIMACRSADKATAARQTILDEISAADLRLMGLDLADLASVRAFAAALREEVGGIDVLINNAGVMAIPRRQTADGFEMQLGTNHLGHFALTGLLLDLIPASGRVVTMSSQAHRTGRMRWADLQWERGYSKWQVYGQAKLANLLFTFELQRRLPDGGPIAVAAHPGYANTNLQYVGPKMEGSSFGAKIMDLGAALIAQSAEMGALPELFAATSPDVHGGDYIGPCGLFEVRGHPRKVQPAAKARDAEAMRRLWEVSEELTGVRYLD